MLRKTLVVLVLCGAVLVAEARAATLAVRKGIEIEDLGAPVKSSVVVRESLVENAVTGDLHLIGNLASSPLQIFDFNLTRETAHVTDPVDGAGWRSWIAYPHSNGKFYLGTGTMLIEYDPSTKAVRTWKGKVPPHTRGDMSHMAEGRDGRLALAGYGRYMWRFDPKTEELRRYGKLPGNKYFYTMAYREPYAYICLAGGGNWYLCAWDLDTGRFETFLEPSKTEKGRNYIRAVGEADDGHAYFFGKFDADGKRVSRCYRLVDGKPVEVAKRPPGLWSSHHQCTRKAWPVNRTGPLGLELDLTQMTPTGWNDGTMVLRWRKKGEDAWRELTAEAKVVEPATLRRLAATPEGTLLGCTEPYGLFFTLDPKTGESACLGRPPGNVYDLIVDGDRAYLSGYSKMFAVYDRTRPWTYVHGTTTKDTNPLPLLGWGKRNCYMALGRNGVVYVGGRESRHATGGVVGIYDPKAGKRDQMREAFAAKQIFDLVTINDGALVVVSWQDELVTYDPARGKIVKTIPKPTDAILAGNIFDGSKDCVVALSWVDVPENRGSRLRGKAHINPGMVYKVNCLTGEMLYKRVEKDRFFVGTIRELNRRVRTGPDGCGWFFITDPDHKRWLARVHPDDGVVERVIETGVAGHLCFLGDDIYLYNGGEGGRNFTTLKRIRSVFQR